MTTWLRLLTVIAITCAAMVHPAFADTPRGRDFHLDGMKLGEPVSSVLIRASYRSPCDLDPIEDRTRRIVVYTDRPCRHKSFPQKSSLALFFTLSKDSVFKGSIEAMTWMGGTFFAERSDFPAFVGMTRAHLRAIFGKPVDHITRGEEPSLSIARYGEDIYAVFDKDVAVGFVLGAMPKDPTKESWGVVAKLYRRYTTPVVLKDGSVSKTLRCTAFVNRVLQLQFAQKTQRYHAMGYAEQLEKKHKRCVEKMTDKALECALGARSMDELAPCLDL